MRENKTCPYEGWKQLPTEELDQILQAELEKDRPNEEVVLPVLHELEEREKDYPVEKTPDNLALIEKLKKHNTSSKQPKWKHGWIAGIAAVAAVACVVVMALPRTVGAESIFDVLFRWTGSVFEFFTPEQDATNPSVEYLFETDHPGLQQLYDKVTELGITDPVVPMWLPEGFGLSDLKASPAPGGSKVHGKFANDSNAGIVIIYRISADIKTSFEKEDSSVEVYDYADVSHFILENDDGLSATWTLDGVECLLNGNIAKEDLYTIIKSIYRGELSQ
ncbi:MAG: DUF4367 domain-containing protein [Oscillospiraceae bacterium]|nr:DUF4367 domain-containing protein [Oscillospiraceae bacterium]